jgi:hypothetical protein
MASITSHALGNWAQSLAYGNEAEQIMRSRCIGLTWELDTAQLFCVWSLASLGAFAELSRRVPRYLREAQDRGDRYLATNLRIGSANLAWLARDHVSTARRVAEEGIQQWSRQGYHSEHYTAMMALAHIDLYLGHGRLAYERIQLDWPRIQKSLVLRVQVCRIEAWQLRARAAVAAAAESPGDAVDLLKDAERLAGRIARENQRWSNPMASLLEAAVASLRQQPELAVSRLAEAAHGFESMEMPHYVSAVRRRLGELVGGDEGSLLIAAADAWMSDELVKNPRRMTALLAPGFPP